MQSRRVHLTGASGSGTTTLGRALAAALASAHHDTDDYFWVPTNAAVSAKARRCGSSSPDARGLLATTDWVLSGSLTGWGDPLVPLFDLVVFLIAPAEFRVQRLRQRETRRFGADAVAPGAWRYRATEEFIAWASDYDHGRE
jgi:adenylate kinase family enzyme